MIAARRTLLASALSVCVSPAWATLVSPFISEIHYDNAGGDVGEFVAVTGPAGLDLDGWSLLLYNGGNGQVYRTLALGGILSGGAGLAEAYWQATGLQNGPDGVALVSAQAVAVDFVAYESAFVASNGAAAGMQANLLPLGEDATTAVGMSLQRTGGLRDWSWTAAPATPGIVNDGLALALPTAVPQSAPWSLWLAGLIGWWGLVCRRERVPGLPAEMVA